MEQKRLFIAIAVSVAILLGFEFLVQPHLPHPPPPPPSTVASNTASTIPGPASSSGAAGGGATAGLSAPAAAAAASTTSPTVKIKAPSLDGSISLRGALLDNIVLTDYHETIDPKSPLVQLLEPTSESQPYYIQYGWTAAPGAMIDGAPVKLPDSGTLWTASEQTLDPDHPLTLTWPNGQGLTFSIKLAIDDRYMFTVNQSVESTAKQPVALYPWSRIRRDYQPPTSGYYLLYEGPVGVFQGTLHEIGYKNVKSTGAHNDGLGYNESSDGGLAGLHRQVLADGAHPQSAGRCERSGALHHRERDAGLPSRLPGEPARDAHAGGRGLDEQPASSPAPRWSVCWIAMRASMASRASTRPSISASSTS